MCQIQRRILTIGEIFKDTSLVCLNIHKIINPYGEFYFWSFWKRCRSQHNICFILQEITEFVFTFKQRWFYLSELYFRCKSHLILWAGPLKELRKHECEFLCVRVSDSVRQQILSCVSLSGVAVFVRAVSSVDSDWSAQNGLLCHWLLWYLFKWENWQWRLHRLLSRWTGAGLLSDGPHRTIWKRPLDGICIFYSNICLLSPSAFICALLF